MIKHIEIGYRKKDKFTGLCNTQFEKKLKKHVKNGKFEENPE